MVPLIIIVIHPDKMLTQQAVFFVWLIDLSAGHIHTVHASVLELVYIPQKVYLYSTVCCLTKLTRPRSLGRQLCPSPPTGVLGPLCAVLYKSILPFTRVYSPFQLKINDLSPTCKEAQRCQLQSVLITVGVAVSSSWLYIHRYTFEIIVIAIHGYN